MAKRHHHKDMREHAKRGNERDDMMYRSHRRGMIAEDMSAPACLPQRVVHEYYDMPDYYALDGSAIGNLYTGVQDQISRDSRDLRREKRPSKY